MAPSHAQPRWGVIGYTVAIFLGPLVMAFAAPKFREQMPEASNVTDWVGQRFGRGPQIYVTIVLIYYMFIYLVGQLKTMGDMTVKFYGEEWEPKVVGALLLECDRREVGSESFAPKWDVRVRSRAKMSASGTDLHNELYLEGRPSLQMSPCLWAIPPFSLRVVSPQILPKARTPSGASFPSRCSQWPTP